MKKKITKKQVLEFLMRHKHVALSTVAPDGKPEASTIYYGANRRFDLFFAAGTLSRKFKNLQKNPHVALVVTDAKKLITVQMEGVAQVVQTLPKEKQGIQTLAKALTPSLRETLESLWDPIPPVIKMKNGKLAIFKVKIQWARWADFSLPAKEAKGSYFVEVKI